MHTGRVFIRYDRSERIDININQPSDRQIITESKLRRIRNCTTKIFSRSEYKVTEALVGIKFSLNRVTPFSILKSSIKTLKIQKISNEIL